MSQMISTSNNNRVIIRIGQGVLSVVALNASSQITDYASVNMKSGVSAAANLREAFKNIDLLKQPYDHADVMLSMPTMLIPADEFHSEDASVLYDHTFNGYDRCIKSSYAIPELHVVAVFSIDKDVKTVMDDHFAESHYVPVCIPVWKHLYSLSYGKPRQKLYGYFHDGEMYVFCFHQNRFKFNNAFHTSQVHDALYFLLYTFSQLGLKGERDAICIIGSVPQKKWLLDRIRTYVGEVSAPDAKDTGLPDQLRWPSIPYDMQTFINQISR